MSPEDQKYCWNWVGAAAAMNIGMADHGTRFEFFDPLTHASIMGGHSDDRQQAVLSACQALEKYLHPEVTEHH